eukprot:TRINITY_DN15116_c0_g3_i1.p1 TRINITY_DN15116_c0_g3~~TRINITY_DN15116_c0_g3_i1.p1  ORF type:complete len:187 (+),score=12.10 TRINITY_DN15116_c0_g3_i1:140-700(+)
MRLILLIVFVTLCIGATKLKSKKERQWRCPPIVKCWYGHHKIRPHYMLFGIFSLKLLDGRFFSRPVYLKSFHGTYLKALKNGKVALSHHKSKSAQWRISKLKGGKFAFKSIRGTYLTANPDKSLSLAGHLKKWEMWKPIKLSRGKLGFRSYHRTHLRAGSKGIPNLTTILRSWEHWTVIPKRKRYY